MLEKKKIEDFLNNYDLSNYDSNEMEFIKIKYNSIKSDVMNIKYITKTIENNFSIYYYEKYISIYLNNRNVLDDYLFLKQIENKSKFILIINKKKKELLDKKELLEILKTSKTVIQDIQIKAFF